MNENIKILAICAFIPPPFMKGPDHLKTYNWHYGKKIIIGLDDQGLNYTTKRSKNKNNVPYYSIFYC